MPTPRMLPDTVRLYNFAGEVNDEAVYKVAVIKRCYCTVRDASTPTGNGTAPGNRVALYIFDRGSIVADEDGNKLTFIPHEEWDALPDKSGYWTLRDGPSRDYFVKVGKYADPRKIPVIAQAHLTGGAPRMWHFEVTGA